MPSTCNRLATRTCNRIFQLAFALVLALALAPMSAYGETRTTDIVLGKTAEEREIDVSELPDIAATHAIVVSKDGTPYFERDADSPVKIASITKVMTAIVALEHAQLTDVVTVDHAAATVGGSTADLKEGDTLTMDVALKALMIPSGNDAAMAIATTVGKKIDPSSPDPFQTFINAMNDTAAKLGMEHSVFANPSGLDFDQWAGTFHSTARDVATMWAHAMKNETFRAVVADTDRMITVKSADGSNRTIELDWHNDLLGTHGNIGAKTGTTDEAGYCFVGAYAQDTGGEAYIVNLNSETDQKRYDDSAALADWLYGHMVAYPLVTSERATAGGSPLVARVAHADWSDRAVDVVAKQADKKVGIFSLAGEVTEQADLPQSVSGDVKAGQKLGTLTLSQDGREVGSVELVSAEDEPAPNPLQWVLVQLDRLVRAVQGQPTVAASEQLFQTPEAGEVLAGNAAA